MPRLRHRFSCAESADKGIASKIAGTFNSLVKLADFTARADPAPENADESEDEEDDEDEEQENTTDKRRKIKGSKGGLRPEFHYNIQVHLPDNASEETYLSIFNAIRKIFK
jgi:hypothetical protein